MLFMYQEYDHSKLCGWLPIFGVAMIYGGMTFIMDFEDFFLVKCNTFYKKLRGVEKKLYKAKQV